MSFEIEINKKRVSAVYGETILDVLNRNGINVPTLCHMNLKTAASWYPHVPSLSMRG